jgi:hypothetical protein
MLFIYPCSPVATICNIAFYIQKPYIRPKESSFTFRMTRTKEYFPVYNVCSMFTTRCELDLYIQCKLNSVFKGHRSILKKRYLHKTLAITKCITQSVLLCQFRRRSLALMEGQL